ncbi:MAG: hypothetical protein IBX55_19725 [Methyloprofundus sp.]|nr:hypothetical protein [Methyloprofundus sp.]
MCISSSVDDLIVKGLHATFNDLYRFTGDELDVSHPEYLLTVNIAKSLAENFFGFNGYDIRIECPTKYLIRHAFKFKMPKFHWPLHKNKNCQSTKRYIKGLEKVRKGRVDIALFKQGGFSKVLKYVFEIKRPNQAKKSIIQDLVRLKTFCLLENEDGFSDFQAGYFIGLQYFQGYQTPDKIKQNLDITTFRFRSYIQEVNHDRKVCEELRVFTLNNPNIVDENEFEAEFIGAHHVVGVIIELKRNV